MKPRSKSSETNKVDSALEELAKDLEGNMVYNLREDYSEGYLALIMDYKKIAKNLYDLGYRKVFNVVK